MKKIILTGGGTAGHVTPNIALLPRLKEAGYEVVYVGSYTGIEKELMADQGIPYYGISSGKLRRYKSLKNLSDPFRVLRGFFQAMSIVRKEKPNVLFSKGGFVSVPVVWAARLRRVPVVIHESDLTPGLANKLSFSTAKKICCNFPETVKYLPEEKAVLTGSPIRAELLCGNASEGKKICGFTDPADERPILLAVGGSTGAKALNETLRAALDELLAKYRIIHLCGNGFVDESLNGKEGYVQLAYAKDELKDLFAACDIVLSRAGANAICELLALNKPNILVPLPLSQSRGDQILNAKSFRAQGFSFVLEEENMTVETLISSIDEVYANNETYISAMQTSSASHGVEKVFETICSVAK